MDSTAMQRHTTTAITLHWLLAACIVGSIALGLYMTGLPMSPARLKYYNWHKWAGVSILALSVMRGLWRITHRPPPALPMPDWQRRISAGTHHLLYLLPVAVPLAGWAYSSAAGFPVVAFGVLSLPDLSAPDKELATALKALHKVLAWAMAGFVVLHVGGVLKHEVVDRDGLLRRMWPSGC